MNCLFHFELAEHITFQCCILIVQNYEYNTLSNGLVSCFKTLRDHDLLYGYIDNYVTIDRYLDHIT